MRNIITLFFFILSISVSGQWNDLGECQEFVPPLPQDSVFLVMSDSREGIRECRGEWRSAQYAGVVMYKTYIAYLTQTGTNAPEATVLINTLGDDLVWSRSTTGEYYATANLEVFSNPTPHIQGFIRPSHNTTFYWGERSASTVFTIHTLDDIFGTHSDNLLDSNYGHPIEIRVYFQ